MNNLAHIFGWPQKNLDLCGRQLVQWSAADQLAAEIQAAKRELDAQPRLAEEQADRLRAVRHETVLQSNTEWMAAQTARDARIMRNARSHIKRPRSINNVSLCMELFGAGWHTANKMCEEMGMDPKSCSSEPKVSK